jgi:GAF domain-containing protein
LLPSWQLLLTVPGFESSYRDLARQSWRRIARSPGEYDIRIGTPEILGKEEDGAFTTSKQSEDSGLPVLSDDRRELSVPVQMRGEIIATITARRGEDEELWSDDDVSLLRAVAGQTARVPGSTPKNTVVSPNWR